MQFSLYLRLVFRLRCWQYPPTFQTLTPFIRDVMATQCVQYNVRFERGAISITEELGNSASAWRLDVNKSTICGWRNQQDVLFKCKAGRKGSVDLVVAWYSDRTKWLCGLLRCS